MGFFLCPLPSPQPQPRDQEKHKGNARHNETVPGILRICEIRRRKGRNQLENAICQTICREEGIQHGGAADVGGQNPAVNRGRDKHPPEGTHGAAEEDRGQIADHHLVGYPVHHKVDARQQRKGDIRSEKPHDKRPGQPRTAEHKELHLVQICKEHRTRRHGKQHEQKLNPSVACHKSGAVECVKERIAHQCQRELIFQLF